MSRRLLTSLYHGEYRSDAAMGRTGQDGCVVKSKVACNLKVLQAELSPILDAMTFMIQIGVLWKYREVDDPSRPSTLKTRGRIGPVAVRNDPPGMLVPYVLTYRKPTERSLLLEFEVGSAVLSLLECAIYEV